MWKGFSCWHIYAEEGAKGFPAFFDAVDEQFVWRDALFDLFDVLVKYLDSVGFVLEAVGEGVFPDQFAGDASDARPTREKPLCYKLHHTRSGCLIHPARYLVDGIVCAFVPGFGVTGGQNHLCIWVDLHEFFVESTRRPVYSSLIACKDVVPIDALAIGGGQPERDMFRVIEHFGHVIARAKAEFFEGGLEGERAGSSKARANYFEFACLRDLI